MVKQLEGDTKCLYIFCIIKISGGLSGKKHVKACVHSEDLLLVFRVTGSPQQSEKVHEMFWDCNLWELIIRAYKSLADVVTCLMTLIKLIVFLWFTRDVWWSFIPKFSSAYDAQALM